MLKKELAELLKNNKDDDNIDEILGKTEPVKALVNSGLTLDAFKAKLNEPDFKSFIDSINDKHFKKAMETFKTNGNLDKLVNEKYLELHPEDKPKDPIMVQLLEENKQNKARLEQIEKEKLKEALTNKAFKIATEKNLPVDLIDFVIGDDEEATKQNLDTLAVIFSKHDEALKAQMLKDNTYIPPKGGGAETTENPWSKEHYNLTMQGKILRENPELARKYMAEAKK